MDKVEKTTGKRYKQAQTPQYTASRGEPWELWLENEKISTEVKHQLLDHTCRQATWEYWANKTQFHGMDIQSIDWTTVHTVVKGMTINRILCNWTNDVQKTQLF